MNLLQLDCRPAQGSSVSFIAVKASYVIYSPLRSCNKGHVPKPFGYVLDYDTLKYCIPPVAFCFAALQPIYSRQSERMFTQASCKSN